MQPNKIVYLLGAGATHAEIFNLVDSPSVTYLSKYGLLIRHVSQRVINSAQKSSGFKKNAELVTSAEGSLNIELLISLFESSRIVGSENKVSTLKKLVREDIENILTKYRMNRFYLHKALFELHQFIIKNEDLLGVISLNYDNVLDDAFRVIHSHPPNYNFTSERGDNLPLLKLHGSFNWKKINIYGNKREIPIIPLGMNKNYLFPPYNFIWSRAFEILVNCDVLRIIGCSLNSNDIGLIDLLFKAHLHRNNDLEIQIIDSMIVHENIKQNYGFFNKLVGIEDIEKPMIADVLSPDTGNPFKTWLKSKALKMLNEDITKTRFLKKCL